MSEKENTEAQQGFPALARPPLHLRKMGQVSPTWPQSPHFALLPSVPENVWLKTFESFFSHPLLVLTLTYGAQQVQQRLAANRLTALFSSLIVRKQFNCTSESKRGP